MTMRADSQELEKEYALRFGDHAPYREAVWEILVHDYFQPLIGESRVILDLGSGWGEFINRIRASKRYAMDLNPEGARRIVPGITFLQQDCSERWNLEDGSLDVVFTSNFFEHLPTKEHLARTLAEARRCLKPGGRLICLGPNMRYVGSAYWDFFDHHLALSHLSLTEALRMSDFEVGEVIPRFLPYTMADGRRPPLALVRLYLKLPWIWRWFGHQFLIVAVKP